MIILPLGVIWAGYTLVWLGWSTLQNNGVGLLDLVNPANMQKAISGVHNTNPGDIFTGGQNAPGQSTYPTFPSGGGGGGPKLFQ